jgi:hypothetical protein
MPMRILSLDAVAAARTTTALRRLLARGLVASIVFCFWFGVCVFGVVLMCCVQKQIVVSLVVV